jgi:hypothetical protein
METLAEIWKSTEKIEEFIRKTKIKRQELLIEFFKNKTLDDVTSINHLCMFIEITKHILEKKNLEKNETYTPESAFVKINRYIPKNKIIWEAFLNGNFDKIKSPSYLRNLGHTVIATDDDFFKVNHGDIVVSMPPSIQPINERWDTDNIKFRILHRLCSLEKPFMLLIPISFMQTSLFYNLTLKFGDFQFIMPTKRIKFYRIKDDGSEEVYKEPRETNTVCWYCWRMNLEKDIVFIQ